MPPSYKAFLAEHDGGEPVRSCFSLRAGRAGSRTASCRRSSASPPSPDGDLVGTAEDPRATACPPASLPIADDPFGNLVCLDGRDGRDGPVLFWDHESEGDPPDEANLYEIAPDLRDVPGGARGDARPLPPQQPRKGLQRLFGG